MSPALSPRASLQESHHSLLRGWNRAPVAGGDTGTWGHGATACVPRAFQKRGDRGPTPAPGAGVRTRRGRRVRDRGGLHSVDTVSLRRARARLSLRGPARPGACAPVPATALLGPSLSAWAGDSLQGQVQRVGRTRAAGETPHSTERAGPAGRRLLQGARRAASELAACARRVQTRAPLLEGT